MKVIGRLADIIIDLVYVVFTALSALILAVSLMTTVVFRQYEQNDLFDFESENLPLLLLSMLAFFALLLAAYVYALRKQEGSGMSLSSGAPADATCGHIDRDGEEGQEAVPAGKAPFPWLMLAVAGAVSLFLVAAVRGLPTADAALLDEVVEQFAAGDYSGLESGYLRNYPFQIFYVYFGEILLNLFGEYDNLAWQLLNVIAIECFMYFLYQITWELFGSRTVCLVFQVLSCGAFCLYAFSTFIYLDLVSMAVQAAAMYLQILYMKRGRIRYEAAAGLCISAAILMKMNCLIALIAMIIFLIVDAVRKSIRNPEHTARRLFRAAALCVMLIAFTWAGSAALNLYTLLRTGMEVPDGFPAIAYLAMGLQMTEGKCGWYNGFTVSIWAASGYDAGRTTELAWEAIQESIAEFDNSGRYFVNFFYQKFISQWGDSTCVSMKELENTYRHTQERALADFLIFGAGSTMLQWVMNVFHSMIYLGNLFYAAGVFRGRRKEHRSTPAPEAMIVIYIFGGMVFHEFWEASGRYIMRYYLFMMPLAALGWTAAAGKARAFMQPYVSRRAKCREAQGGSTV